MKHLYLILIFTILWSQISFSQKFYTRNYNINNGLPDNTIRDIFKDSRGFLWLGTDAGLSQFDGKSFQTYTTENGLAGDKVWSITETQEGHIWIGCHDGGISKLVGKEIISYDKESGLVSNYVRKIHFSKNYNILLIGTEDGLSVLQNDRFISFHQRHNNVPGRLQVTQFIEEDDFIYVFTNGNGLYKYIPQAESLIRIPSDHQLNKFQVNSAYISKSGDTLINYRRKNLLTLSNNKKTNIDFIGQITDYVEDSKGNIWISSWDNNYMNAGGIFRYDKTEITRFGDFLNIKAKDVWSLEFDSNENLLWIGTKGDGLYLYPLINFYYYNAGNFGLDELNITDIKIDSLGNLWLATQKNIIKNADKQNHKIFPFELFERKYKSYANSKFKEKYAYLIDKNGSFQKYQDLILNNRYHYPNPYKRLNGNILPAKSLYRPLKYDILINKQLKRFNSISFDQDGNIWIGSNVGIFKINKENEAISYFDLEGNQFTDFFIDSENTLYGISWADLFISPNINNNYSYKLYNYYEDKSPINISKIIELEDQIWFSSTDHGLFVYNGEEFYSTYGQSSFETPSFNDICKDKNGNIFAGGNNGKIYFVRFVNNEINFIQEIGKSNGLRGTSIRYLCCTKDNFLIAGTNDGLNIIDLNKLYETGHVKINCIYDAKGFTDYSGKLCAVQNNEKFWIGSNNNVIQIDLKSLEKINFKSVNLYLKSLLINEDNYDLSNNENIDPWTNIPKNAIKLPYHKNSLTFSYDAITFLDPENISFSYKLEGYHNNWIVNTKDRKAIFQNLKPGKYRLRIKVDTEESDLSEEELSVNFIISRPFWITWWFVGITLIIIVSVVWLLIIFRTRSIKKKERIRREITERMSEFEMKALRAQMNPHFIFNAINSIQNFMLGNDVDSALYYLSDFAKLIRLTLDNVSKKRITLEEELNYIKYYINLEQMRFDTEFEIEIIMPQDWEGGKILIPSMILQPFIENCIKHAFVLKKGKAKIKLEFQITENSILKCIVEDNGIGRKKSRELNKNRKNHTSKGTFITFERLALLNQTQSRKEYRVEIIDLYDEFDLASGTRVEVYLPF